MAAPAIPNSAPWRRFGRPTEPVHHAQVLAQIHDEAGWSGRYLFTLLMSAGIAVLGLLLSSPAVVIGAMLISPLMGPIIGLGFALATVDAPQIRRAVTALAAGSALAILFCAVLVLVSPLQNVTSEIAGRTRPNLFDQLVALFSALAGAYATIRGRAGTVVGVAIATALMPPLATVGFGLATWNGAVFGGALLLFVTNFVTIALAAAVVARAYGFGPRLSPHQTLLQSLLVLLTFAALAVPLGLSLRRAAWESRAGSAARAALADVFGKDARVSQVGIDFDARPIRISAIVLTPKYRAEAEAATARRFEAKAGRKATVALTQYRVGTGPGAAEAASIKTADVAEPAPPPDTDIADRLALLAGVGAEQVLVDPTAKRARVVAAPLPGANLAVFHALEQRAAAATPGWRVTLVPPPVAPDAPRFAGNVPDAADVADLAWGAQRLGYALAVIGPPTRTKALVAALTEAGVDAARAGSAPAVTLRWAPPPTPPR